jgi:hypothetical protein
MQKEKFLATVFLVIALTLSISARAQPFQWDSPLGVVMRLYHDYAYQSVIENGGVPYNNVTNEPEHVLEQYFDPELTCLVLAEQKCAVASGGICNIDFAVMWNSQDSTGVTVEIKPTKEASIIEVALKYPGFPPASPLIYEVTKSSRGYRIHDIRMENRVHDIRSENWSLINLLNGSNSVACETCCARSS